MIGQRCPDGYFIDNDEYNDERLVLFYTNYCANPGENPWDNILNYQGVSCLPIKNLNFSLTGIVDKGSYSGIALDGVQVYLTINGKTYGDDTSYGASKEFTIVDAAQAQPATGTTGTLKVCKSTSASFNISVVYLDQCSVKENDIMHYRCYGAAGSCTNYTNNNTSKMTYSNNCYTQNITFYPGMDYVLKIQLISS